MHTSTSSPSPRSRFLTQVMQGVMLGTVLAVPVALWAYTSAQQPQMEAQAVTSASASKVVARRATAPSVRKPIRVTGKEAPVIPASQMHVRIDDGSRRRVASTDADN